MSAFYAELRAQAGQLLAELGRPIRFRRYESVNDLVEGTSVPTLIAEQTLSGATLPASAGTLEAFDVRFMDNVQDDSNVRFAIVSAEGAAFTPGPKDMAELGSVQEDGTVVFDGKSWHVMGCTPLDVDGVSVIYNIGFRLPS
jgi:hypothetical protein